MANKKKKKAAEGGGTAAPLRKPAPSPASPARMLLFILAATFICLFPVLQNDFLNFDDPQYVTENPVVQHLDGANFKSFFTQAFVGNYQPIVMLSYAVQFKIFGLHASGYHFFSLLMHLLNTALVFLLAARLLKSTPGAGITALLFGIHPLHVESVAWIASQKDVLYTFFFLLSSLFYLRYTDAGRDRKWYVLSMAFFVLSALSKAQAVVLPVVFLLFDYLLKRKEAGEHAAADAGGARSHRVPWSRLLLEKVPFFALSVILGLMAIHYQKEAGAVQDFNYFKPHERVLFASYGFMAYLIQTVAPVKLGIFYPYPETDGKINSQLVYLAPIGVLAVAALVFYFRKRLPVLLFGALFFCVTIALVIQLIPVGDALHADRYTYISLIGIFIFAGYLFARYYEHRQSRAVTAGIAGAYLLAMGVLTFSRSKVFHDNVSVYSDSLRNHPAAIIYSNLGAELYKMAEHSADANERKRLFGEALLNISKASELKPRFPNVWFNRGLADAQLGNVEAAINDYSQAVQHNPNDFNIFMQRGSCYLARQQYDAGIADFTRVIAINPGVINAYYSRAEGYGKSGRIKEAIDDYNKVLSMKPDFPDAYINRAIAYSIAGNTAAALADYEKALQLNPTAWGVYFNRSNTLKNQGRYAEALRDAETAQKNGYPVDERYMTELRALAGK
jgi:tetratricopeptide (TPR) repeat protein